MKPARQLTDSHNFVMNGHPPVRKRWFIKSVFSIKVILLKKSLGSFS
jgi:hypothetical protein